MENEALLPALRKTGFAWLWRSLRRHNSQSKCAVDFAEVARHDVEDFAQAN